MEDARYKHCVGPIENGNNEPFLNYDIPTPATILDFTIVYVILKNHGAMIQFRDGLQSIDSEMKRTENYAIMKILLTYSECVIDFDQFMALLHFEMSENSIVKTREEDAQCNFEIFISKFANKTVYITADVYRLLTLEDILFFFTGMNKVPMFGFEKTIDIRFVDSITLPDPHTCSLEAELPF